jgi:DNA-binding NarL/FixJ family response regulator
MPPKILIVDDHEVVRQGVRTILRARPQWQVCGEAMNGREAVELAGKHDPDIIIMDITMPEMSGIEATEQINRLGLRPAVLIFTMHESRSLLDVVRQVGARGLVLKSRAANDLIEALDTLMAGGTFFGADTLQGGGDQSSERRAPA